MDYRDDREALRGEVDNLKAELASARADQARLEDFERRLAAAKREILALEAELGARRGRRRSSPAWIALPLAIVGIAVASGAGLLVIRRPIEPPSALAPLPQTIPEPPSPPAPPPPPLPEAEGSSRRMAQVSWSATVTKSNAPAVRAGSSCRISAGVVPDASGMHVVDVKVTCGAQTIYDQGGRLNGTSQLDSDARQRPGSKPGTWVYDLVFSDVGTRSATRNQAQLDSTAKLGKIWSENLPELRVDLAIKSGSDPIDVAILDPGQ